ncbi:transcriptional regulator [Frondihabitans sp. PAMC 28766]|uniref:helix-turn-helix transcriptional regulator n=1 Tax=Frondihabitans sp. PAMC 28766 TaxID=1795630 RepID=UPI00078DA753|nr:WYL domain-containing protein [Frondihabitans sp. PAMC 28766]AMM20789.1 transcriptional regulator [Frondihabitans sp. PAMC 28766]
MPAARAPRIPVEERLFSLVLALLATDTGLTKTEILSTVQGYRQRWSQGDNAALERQFERDKDDIRELGVPLETIEEPGASGNNQNLRYRIPRGAYELPDDIAFSSEETALLTLAAMVWREGTLSGESRRALLKLRSLGGATPVPELDYAPRIHSRDAAFEPLRTALDRSAVVTFDYLKPGEDRPRARTVVPYALVQFQGRWMCPAIDPDTGGWRTFLLSRIVSPVTITNRIVETPAEATADRSLADLESLWEGQTTRVQVVANSDAETRLLKRRGTVRTSDTELEIHWSDRHLLADELASFGPEVVVTSPPEIVSLVRARLAALVDDHQDPAPLASDIDEGRSRG